MNKSIILRPWFILLISLLILILATLAYFQFFYQAKRVDSGMVRLERIFRDHKDIVSGVRFSPNDSLVLSGSVDSTLIIRERQSGKIIRIIKQPAGISFIDLSTDGHYIVTGSYDHLVRLWNFDDGRLLKTFSGHEGTVWTVCFSPDGKYIASSGDDAIIKIWDCSSGKLVRNLKGHTRIVWSVRFSPDGNRLVSCSFDFSLKTWNVSDGRLLRDNREHTETVVDAAFSHDGKLLASTSDDKTVRIWNTGDGSLVRMMHTPEHVQAVAFSPDDKYLVTGGRDKPMIGELLQNFFGDSHYNKGVSARLWDVQTGQLLHSFVQHENDVMEIDYSHNGKWIATASADRTVALWERN
jgi:WD40 repeat protein